MVFVIICLLSLISHYTDDSNKEELVRWNVTGTCKPIVIGSVSKGDKCVEISRNGEYVIYTYKNKLFIYTPSHNKSNSYVFDDTHITCTALHPTELVVCTGDKKGKIVLWYNLFGDGKQICTKLHWHNLPVADMLFTNDGMYKQSLEYIGVSYCCGYFIFISILFLFYLIFIFIFIFIFVFIFIYFIVRELLDVRW